MDIRSKLKLFNDEILVSTSCVDDSGNYLFDSWYFPKTVDSSYCGVVASQKWVEGCAFFDKIEACGFYYSKTCGLLIEPSVDYRFHFSDSGIFSVTACGLTINAACNDVCVRAKEVVSLCVDSKEPNENPAYIQIGYYESQDQDKIGVKAYGEDVIISSKNKTSIDSGTLDISSDGELNITAGGTIRINTFCTEMCFINVSTASTFGGYVYFDRDSSINVDGNTTFTCFPPEISEELSITKDNQLVSKSYVDNATATSFFCSYNDTEEHTISIDTKGIYFSPEKIKIHGCGGVLLIDRESDDSRINFEANTGFSSVPSISNTSLCLGNGFGHTYFATEAYVDKKLSETYCSFFNDGLTVGRGACVVEINTDTDVILFNETELPTTGGTVLTSENIYNKIPIPCTCVWWLEPKSPDENGKVTWTCELMYNGQQANSDVPPNVVVTKIDESNSDKFHYVDADVSFWTSGDMGVINSSYISVNMNSNDAIPQCTFKVTISNIHINNSLT